MKDAFNRIVDRTVEQLKTDTRFRGLAISGSWVRNEMDEFSDLDLMILCNDESVPTAEEMKAFAEKLGGLVSSFTGEHVGEPSLLICMYKDPLIHVDLKFSVAVELEKRQYDSVIAWERDSAISDVYGRVDPIPVAPNFQWIEDRFWTWVHYATQRLGRGELLDLVCFLGFIREQVLGPMALHASGFPSYGVRKIERYLPEFVGRLEKTIATYDVSSCHSALVESIEIYRELRGNLAGVTVNAEAESECMGYLAQIEGKIVA